MKRRQRVLPSHTRLRHTPRDLPHTLLLPNRLLQLQLYILNPLLKLDLLLLDPHQRPNLRRLSPLPFSFPLLAQATPTNNYLPLFLGLG